MVRAVFYIEANEIRRKKFSFKGFPNTSRAQKRKNILSLHEASKEAGFMSTLEVSIDATTLLGARLSDNYKLKIAGVPFENVFASSKVFENGGPYKEMLTDVAVDICQDARLINSGAFKHFEFEGEIWEPHFSLAFYDYLYCRAVKESMLSAELNFILAYDAFSDIYFELIKSKHTNARRVAFIKLLLNKFGKIPNFTKEEFCEFHKAACAKL